MIFWVQVLDIRFGYRFSLTRKMFYFKVTMAEFSSISFELHAAIMKLTVPEQLVAIFLNRLSVTLLSAKFKHLTQPLHTKGNTDVSPKKQTPTI